MEEYQLQAEHLYVKELYLLASFQIMTAELTKFIHLAVKIIQLMNFVELFKNCLEKVI